jgi:hypothetical protein
MALAGVSSTQLSKENGIGYKSILRHMKVCAKRDLAKATDSRNLKAGSTFLDEVMQCHEDARNILVLAREADSLDVACSAIGQALRALEMKGKADGSLPTGGNVNVMLGVRVDVAQTAVKLVQDAQAIEPREVVARAGRVLRAWNAANPEAIVTLDTA